MRISELRKIVREVVRNSVKESVFDDKGLERAGTGLPQTEEEPIEHPIEEGHSCGCNEVHDCGCGGHDVNEGKKYYVGYNKGRGQGTGIFKTPYNSYNDAKKEVEKTEKMMRGSYNMTAYYVADEDGKFVRESVNESANPREKALIDTFNNIVKTHSALKVKDGGKTTLVDVQSANVVLKLYDALSDKNKESLFKMPIPQMIKMAWHVMGKKQ